MTRSTPWDEHPEHRMTIDDERVGLRVRIDGKLVAETKRGLNLREGRYPAVVYVPREDVRMERLAPNPHTTHCPFKGDANYFDFLGDGQPETLREKVAWSYETPFDQMSAIRDHLAFYPDRVTLESGSD